MIPDPKKTCCNSAILQLALLHSLLENGAQKAAAIKQNFKPVFPSIKDYVAFKRGVTAEHNAVKQNADGSVTIE